MTSKSTRGERELPADADIRWDETHAQALRAALGRHAGREDGPFGYCELAGFLFAVACCPELVRPSEWIAIALGEDPDALGEDLPRVLDLAIQLHNHINEQVRKRSPLLPCGVVARPQPMENFAAGAPLSQWARGFSEGYAWLGETWEAYLPAPTDEEQEELDRGLAATLVVLGFFGSRAFAQASLAGMEQPQSVEQMAPRMLETLPTAMASFAELGRALEDIARERRQKPARRARTERNAQCPCGSGRKYKRCCGKS